MTQQLQDEKNNSTGKRIDDEENKNVSIFNNISKNIHVRFKRLIIKIKNFYEINCIYDHFSDQTRQKNENKNLPR